MCVCAQVAQRTVGGLGYALVSSRPPLVVCTRDPCPLTHSAMPWHQCAKCHWWQQAGNFCASCAEPLRSRPRGRGGKAPPPATAKAIVRACRAAVTAVWASCSRALAAWEAVSAAWSRCWAASKRFPVLLRRLNSSLRARRLRDSCFLKLVPACSLSFMYFSNAPISLLSWAEDRLEEGPGVPDWSSPHVREEAQAARQPQWQEQLPLQVQGSAPVAERWHSARGQHWARPRVAIVVAGGYRHLPIEQHTLCSLCERWSFWSGSDNRSFRPSCVLSG